MRLIIDRLAPDSLAAVAHVYLEEDDNEDIRRATASTSCASAAMGVGDDVVVDGVVVGVIRGVVVIAAEDGGDEDKGFGFGTS